MTNDSILHNPKSYESSKFACFVQKNAFSRESRVENALQSNTQKQSSNRTCENVETKQVKDRNDSNNYKASVAKQSTDEDADSDFEQQSTKFCSVRQGQGQNEETILPICPPPIVPTSQLSKLKQIIVQTGEKIGSEQEKTLSAQRMDTKQVESSLESSAHSSVKLSSGIDSKLLNYKSLRDFIGSIVKIQSQWANGTGSNIYQKDNDDQMCSDLVDATIEWVDEKDKTVLVSLSGGTSVWVPIGVINIPTQNKLENLELTTPISQGMALSTVLPRSISSHVRPPNRDTSIDIEPQNSESPKSNKKRKIDIIEVENSEFQEDEIVMILYTSSKSYFVCIFDTFFFFLPPYFFF